MANNTIIIRSEGVYCLVSGRRMTDFPNTGTYIMIEKLTALSVHQEGQHGTSTSVRNNGKSHRITLTLVQNSPDDAFMFNATKVLAKTDGVLSFSLKYNGTTYNSVNCDIETIPNRELAADGSPTMAWTLTGTFPENVVVGFANPTILTEDEING